MQSLITYFSVLGDRYERVFVSLSGGVDSSVLALAASRALGRRAVAVTVLSGLMSTDDVVQVIRVAVRHKIRHQFLPLDLLSRAKVSANGPDRCYHCKYCMFRALKAVAAAVGGVVVDGTNADDDPRRPGRRALNELGIRSPLAEMGLTKAQIRALAERQAVVGANRPANSCLATRIAVGRPLVGSDLIRVERGESLLSAQGFPGCRVRIEERGVGIGLPDGIREKPDASQVRMLESALQTRILEFFSYQPKD